MTFRADDRVLFLGLPSTTELAAMARMLMAGVLVALGTRDEVETARLAMADFDNVIFLDASPDQIPWRDAYFTKVVVPPHLERILPHAATEIHRVMAAGGEIIRTSAQA